MTKERR